MKRREKATRSGAGRTQLPTCQYFKELQFITDTVTNLPTVSNVPTTNETTLFTPPPSPSIPPLSPATSHSYEGNTIPSNATPVAKKRGRDSTSSVHLIPPLSPATSHSNEGNTTPSNATPVAKKRGRDSASGSDMNNLLLQSIQRDLNTPPTQSEKDSDTLFFLSLVQDFKDLPSRKKRLAKLKIMQVISDLHGDDLED